ncbi:MAG: hypothetical protein H8E86_02405 [Planctomycetes bacterium]|nr:hypothetical protein [Planctomycetota bacterium]
MRAFCDTIGGLWVSILLLLRCRCKTGKGSYLAWRKETAFGKDGEFSSLSSKQRRSEVRAWASWAWRSQRSISAKKTK